MNGGSEPAIGRALHDALDYLRQGRLPDAEAACRAVLAREPAHAEATFLLGQVAFEVRRYEAAAALFGRAAALAPADSRYPAAAARAWKSLGNPGNAIACLRRVVELEPASPAAYLELGNAAQEAGQLAESIAGYERALALKPDFADAHCNLGLALHRAGRTREAIASYRRAIAINPSMATAFNNYGFALSESGEFEEAMRCFHEALRLRPDYPEAYCNLGSALGGRKRYAEAAEQFRKALALDPALAEPRYNLGNALMGLERPDDAIQEYVVALRARPDYWEAESALALALASRGRLDAAIACAQAAVQKRPDAPVAARNLGVVLRERGQLAQALEWLRRAIELDPAAPDAVNELAICHRLRGELAAAEAACRRAIALRPDFAEAHCNLGITLGQLGIIEEAIGEVEKALALKPDYEAAESTRLFMLNYSHLHEPMEILRIHREWAGRRAHGLPGAFASHGNVPDPRRRLRIGYVSPDFMQHSVGVFLRPIFEQHDHAACEIFCYSDVRRPDAVTRQLEALADHWRVIVGLSDAEVAAMAHRDGIDILVDLAVHTGSNRLLAFARRPAPVQVTYLGYAGTTGLPMMDYKVTDSYLDPPGLTEVFHSESIVRLADSYFCYQPIPACPEVGARPPGDLVTFGAFQNLSKVTPPTIELWSRVLRAIPGSRLIVKSRGLGEAASRERIRALFERHAPLGDRLLIEDWSDTPEYLRRLGDLDAVLDTTPFNGGTTTCHALWMGVPVIALAGRAALGRMGVSILSNAGLPELVAETPDAYVAIARRLAADARWRAELRRTLRTRLQRSPLMDARRFTASLEACYRQMWETWCASRPR